nr:Uma2 family endonuclease [Chamaesiphon sp. VAR_48_metabat_135_sub]
MQPPATELPNRSAQGINPWKVTILSAVISTDRISIPPGSVMRMPGTWDDYCKLRDSRGDGSIPRLKYYPGEILLMSPLPRHGREANILADIVKVLLESQGRNYEAFIPITMELPEVGGIEPDYCCYIDNWQAVVGKDRIDWKLDPPPDVAIEIDVTCSDRCFHAAILKLLS